MLFAFQKSRNWYPWHVTDCCHRDRKPTVTAQMHKICYRRAVRQLQLSSEKHYVKGRKGTSGSKLGSLISVCCEIMVHIQSQLQERTAHLEDNSEDVIFKK